MNNHGGKRKNAGMKPTGKPPRVKKSMTLPVELADWALDQDELYLSDVIIVALNDLRDKRS